MADTLESFRASWESAQGEDFASRMARRSLEALAAQRDDLEAVLLDLKKPIQESLDLHLKGAGVKGHATDTASLGHFMVQVSEAVKQIAKGMSGRSRWSHNLVSVAPSPGSVRLHFEVPPMKALQADLRGTEVASFDAQALRAMANLLVQAESAAESLDAAAQSLPVPARTAVRHIAKTMVDSHWKFDGRLEARGRPTVELSLSEAGAQRLFRAAAETDSDVVPVTLIGECDGWTWSTGTMRFLAERQKPFSASVPPNLQQEVAQLVSVPGNKVVANFLATHLNAAGTNRRLRTSYALVSIERSDD